MTSPSPAEKYADIVIHLPCVSRMAPDMIIDDAPVFFIAIELLLEALSLRIPPAKKSRCGRTASLTAPALIHILSDCLKASDHLPYPVP